MKGRDVPLRGECKHGLWVWLDGAPVPDDLPFGPTMVFDCGCCSEFRVYVVSLGGSRIHCSYQASGSASVSLAVVSEFLDFLQSLAVADMRPPRVRSWCDLAA